MRQPYLIQRGNFRTTIDPTKRGFDKYIALDYMGASEFEWGAVPESLSRIKNNISDEEGNLVLDIYEFVTAKINKTWITIFAPKSIHNEVLKSINELAKNTISTKEWTGLDVACGYSTFPRTTKINFWWDIQNDWMAYIYTESNHEQFKNSLKDSLKLNK